MWLYRTQDGTANDQKTQYISSRWWVLVSDWSEGVFYNSVPDNSAAPNKLIKDTDVYETFMEGVSAL